MFSLLLRLFPILRRPLQSLCSQTFVDLSFRFAAHSYRFPHEPFGVALFEGSHDLLATCREKLGLLQWFDVLMEAYLSGLPDEDVDACWAMRGLMDYRGIAMMRSTLLIEVEDVQTQKERHVEGKSADLATFSLLTAISRSSLHRSQVKNVLDEETSVSRYVSAATVCEEAAR